MYYPYFITYILIGFTISLAVFFWALRNGQFRDQQRARYLPLEEKHDGPPTRITAVSRFEAIGLFFLAIAGLSASAAVLIFAVLSGTRP